MLLVHTVNNTDCLCSFKFNYHLAIFRFVCFSKLEILSNVDFTLVWWVAKQRKIETFYLVNLWISHQTFKHKYEIQTKDRDFAVNSILLYNNYNIEINKIIALIDPHCNWPILAFHRTCMPDEIPPHCNQPLPKHPRPCPDNCDRLWPCLTRFAEDNTRSCPRWAGQRQGT